MADFTLQDIEAELARRENNLQFSGTTGRSATNNNPLNLEYRPGSYQDKYGAEMEPVSKSGKQRFAKFPDMQSGYQAGLDQIRLDQSRGHTLASFVNKFAPPHENPTAQITAQYAKSLGVSPDTPLSQIPPEKLIVPMLARESSTRVVGKKEGEIYQTLKAPIKKGPRSFEPYQIAAAGGQIPGPPSGEPSLADIEAELARRAQWQPNAQNINAELAARGVVPKIKATSEPIYEMGKDNLLEAGNLDKETMRQAVLNPPNMGYRPEIAKPILHATGMGLGGLIGGAAGLPLGPAGVAAGTVGGGTLGFGLAQKGSEALDTAMGGRPTPTLQESLTKTVTQDIPAGAEMMLGGELAGPAIAGFIKGSGKIGKAILGRLGGTGSKNIEEALTGSDQFTQAMRGKISGEDIVQTAKDAVQVVKDKRSAAYQAQLQKIAPPPGTTAWDIDMSPIQNKLRDLMGNYRVKISPDGALDTSNMAMDKAGRDRIEGIINEVWGWNDKSPMGLDALKRRLDDFYSESSQARAFVAGLRNQVKQTLSTNVPEYAKMTKDYAEATKIIKDFEAGLMTRKQGMTGRVTADMTLRRLTSAMRDNFALRGELVDALGAQASTDLSGQIAGYNMRSILPHGLAGTGPVLAGEAMLAKFVNPKIWPLLVASSPRVQGEFLRVFGKGLRETKGMSLPVGKVAAYLNFLPKESTGNVTIPKED